MSCVHSVKQITLMTREQFHSQEITESPVLAACPQKWPWWLRERWGAADYLSSGSLSKCPLVAAEACLMCHNFPSVTRLNAHFQTLSPSGGIICYNAGVRNPGVVQPVIRFSLLLKKKLKILEMEMFSGKPVCCGRKKNPRDLIISDQVGGWDDLVHKDMKRMRNWYL